MATLEHPHLAAANFYLFLRLKSALKGQHFCNATENIKNPTEELKRLSQSGKFPTPLQSLTEMYSCRGDCFE
jgi:hypothetical protein